MIALAWSVFMVLSMVMASSQAFLTAPLPGYAQGLSGGGGGSSTGSPSLEASTESGRLLRSHVAEAILPREEDQPDDDVDDDEEEDSSASREDYGLQQQHQRGTKRRNDEQTVYVIEFETEADGSKDGSEAQSPLDPWSIVWYIGSFGGLVAFFLIVSCSEWCCRRGARPLSVPYTQRGEVINPNGQPVSESPPPPYHLFAPPPYDSVNYAEIADKSGNGEKLDIYVITMPIQQAPVMPPAQLQEQPPPA
ncbi:uncharacterized protein LOC100678650 isoform X2 [Nasonia vitripennis]|uniref:Uncharacterized protein n=1 Tax=Nasonia vitripennis TaxID=7425 RepID=A0A7M7PYH8_NASVI|nr:uncharacterized protein LOC100678650 isoform X2 [Nasonia vitripennis]